LLTQEQTVSTFKPGAIDAEFMRDLVKLSYFDNGQLLAKESLLKNGIHFIVE
jgi:HTH-type transcriptional regulator / antitoxin HigA